MTTSKTMYNGRDFKMVLSSSNSNLSWWWI